MMSDVGENEQPDKPPEHGPVPSPEQSNWDPEQIRRFQEFLRFQQFQEFSRQQEQQPNLPAIPEPTPQVPAAGVVPSSGAPDIQQQLTGVQQQLAELSASQQRVEQVVNPPLWKKVLRSRPVRWMVGLVVLAILAIWGVPALIGHYFGSGDSAAQRSRESIPPAVVLPTSPKDTVASVYRFIAHDNPKFACQEYFSSSAQDQFARAAGATTCQAAGDKLYTQITDPGGYSDPNLRLLPEPAAGQTTATISSCSFEVSGGPRLGTFTLSLVNSARFNGWQITGYQAPTDCPATTTSTTPSAPGF